MANRGGPTDYPPIADLAIIGDCHTAALIDRDGSIDWYCPDRFDGPAAFCRLLDAVKGGCFRVGPTGQRRSERRYRGPTNVLETLFTAGQARIRLTDFMPVRQRDRSSAGQGLEGSARLLRLVECLGGEAEVELRFHPTLDYARAQTELSALDGGAIAHARGAGGSCLTLTCPGFALEADRAGGLRGRLTLRSGERRWLALTASRESGRARLALESVDGDAELAQTLDFWKRWSAACSYRGPYRAEVLRSALALKLLTYEPTGAVIAAPTTSLPEEIGGVRNWDYRYTWLRDAALILYALMTVGYRASARDFLGWLARACGSDPTATPQIMYTIDGGIDLPEEPLDHLEGYRGSRPVRTGNAAAGQRQLDIYGEVLTAAYLHYRRGQDAGRAGRHPAGVQGDRPPPATWALLKRLVEQAAEDWQEPDNGIWEVRGGPRQFLYSRLMCWAALDRGVRLAREHGLEAPLDRWCRTADAIRQAILERGYDPKLGAFTQAFGSSALDASALAIPRIGFLPATDPRVRSTVERIKADLSHNGLVYRYRTEDRLPGGEATFTLCTYWLVDALALDGRLDEAHDLFEQVAGYANDVGLLSEEIDPISKRFLGNFPQGFTHLALIGSAVNLAKAAKHGAEEQSENEAERADRAAPAATEGHSARARRPG